MWFRRRKPEHHPDYARIAELEAELGLVESQHVLADNTVIQKLPWQPPEVRVIKPQPKFPNVVIGQRELGLKAQQPALQQTPAVWFDSAPVEPPNPVVMNGLAALFGLQLPPEQ